MGRSALIVAALVLLSVAPVSAQDAERGPSDRALRISFAAAIAAHTADITTTAYCLGQRTCHEVNPALRWAERKPVALGLTKGAIAAGLQLIPYHLAKRGHRKAAFWVNVAQTCAFTSIAVRNARHAR